MTTKRSTRSHTECLFMLPNLQKNSCMETVQFRVYLDRSSYSYTKFTLVSWDWARSRTSLCVYSLHWPIQAKYRNRSANFKYLLQTIDHFIRLCVKCVKVNTKLKKAWWHIVQRVASAKKHDRPVMIYPPLGSTWLCNRGFKTQSCHSVSLWCQHTGAGSNRKPK